MKNSIRNLLFPGLDIHTRSRAALCRFWGRGPREVLDAGSGNGYFAWLAYLSGARVTALNFDAEQVSKARDFLVDYRGADSRRLIFEHANLYDLPLETRQFDEIVCFEVLEHLRRDDEVLAQFHRLLKPGGTLHLCCPNRLHPRHIAEVLDTNESGGHVRAGYTEQEFRQKLEPLGFEIVRVVGVGSRLVYWADEAVRAIRSRFGDLVAFPLFAVLLPVVWFARLDPPTPFSIYVSALKQRR